MDADNIDVAPWNVHKLSLLMVTLHGQQLISFMFTNERLQTFYNILLNIYKITQDSVLESSLNNFSLLKYRIVEHTNKKDIKNKIYF